MKRETLIKKADLKMYESWGYVLKEEFTQTFTDGDQDQFCIVEIEEGL